MTTHVIGRIRDAEPLPREVRTLPPPRPESPRRQRTEGIVQAILTWLDEQL
jgi:hypothetical protein